MKRREKILIGILVMVLVLAEGLLIWNNYLRVDTIKAIDVVTSKKGYQKDEMAKIKIENHLKENICFSSCSPYYLETKKDQWTSYSYDDCQEAKLAEKCIEKGGVKAFEFTLSYANEGLHRVVIPVCRDCVPQEEFKERVRAYSEEFVVY